MHFTVGTAAQYKRFISAMKQGRLVLPIAVDVHPTNKCNLKCRWCINDQADDGPTLPVRINQQNMRFLLDQLIKHDNPEFPIHPTTVHFSGGEPLLSRATDVGMMYLIEQGKQVSLVTNGTRLHTRDLFDVVAQIDSVQISLDAGDRKAYHQLKGGDYYRQVLVNIGRLADRRVQLGTGLTIAVNYLLTPHNHSGLAVLLRTLSESGVDQVRFRTDLSLRDDSEFQASMQKKIGELGTKTDLGVVLKSPDVPITKDSFEACFGLWPVAGPDGELYPCADTVQRGMSLGSLWNNNLAEILAGKFPFRPRCQKLCPSTVGNINLLAEEI